MEVNYNGERRIPFNRDWRFQRETDGRTEGVSNPVFDDSMWRKLDVPHDWSIELAFNPDSLATHEGGFLDGGVGWYRKTFTLPETLIGKRISIDFDGVYLNSTTYLNGERLGTYPFGYNAFTYNLTDKLYTDGRENVLVVRVDNTQPSSRWYSGSGIYRNVYLTIADPVHVTRYGTFVTTPDLEAVYQEKDQAHINVKTKVKNSTPQAVEVKLKSTIVDALGNEVAAILSDVKNIAAQSVEIFEGDLTVSSPILWDLDQPYRYKLVTEVIVGDEVTDTYETRFGIRYFEFSADEGFSLNGQYMKLHGVCMHHDLGALGAAVNERAIERQMQIMKEMGVNSVRVSHNPASPELLEIANDLGLLIIDEAFDAWEQAKKTFDYGRFFAEWAEHDIKELVDRGKNEPSIIMWSIGNEIYETTTQRGVEIAKDLVRWVKEVDPTRPTTIGEDKTRADKVNVTPLDPYIEQIFDVVDVVGLNYSENNYQGYHEQHPEWKLYGSETSSATRSRGIYTHPYEYNQSTTYEDLQQSSYDNDYVGWGRTAEDAWKYDRDLKYLAGQYIWTGIDYIGEPTPYYDTFPAKSSYFGAVDTAGFPKDIFYYYQSQWTDEPMLHILPHWNWSEGEKVRILAYTNVQKVELFLNDRSLGERTFEKKETSWGKSYLETSEGDTYLEWQVPFEPGTLRAVAKDENNRIIVEDEVKTAKEPRAIKLTADAYVIDADGKDLSFVTVEVVDEDGHVVPTADNNIHFDLSGSGTLAGVDNGDAASIEGYKRNERRLFSGKALAILQAGEHAGVINLNASGSGLLSDSLTVFTVNPDEQQEKQMAGIKPIYLTVDLNQEPELPSTVTTFYSDRTAVSKSVAWETLDSSKLSTKCEFTIEGIVEGEEEKARAMIKVRDIVGMIPSASVVRVGTKPKLPKEATLIFSDQLEKRVAVKWDDIEVRDLTREHRIIVTGTVSETDLKAEHYLTVTNKEEIGQLATLEKLLINGDSILNLNIDQSDYTYTLPYGSEAPEIMVAGKAGAIVTKLPMLSSENLVKIHVISEDGEAESEYTVRLKTAAPKLIFAELMIEKTAITEDDVIDLNVIGQLESGESIDLNDQSLTYHYDHDMIEIKDNQLYALEPGSTTVKATVESKSGDVATSELNLTIAKNPVAKVIVSIENIKQTVDEDQKPALSERVIVNYDHGLPKKHLVTWDSISEDKYQKVGTFIVEGKVSETDLKAQATITVRGIISVDQPVITILPNQVPELPEKLTAYYNDHSEEQLTVDWSDLDLNKTKEVGQFTLDGSVVESDLAIKATIKITDQISRELNISRAKNGYDYPKAEASYTNVASNSRDRVEAVHDDLISYGNEPHNRWTNWSAEHRSEDWVQITFGDFDPVEFNVDNIEIHWFEDNDVSYPESYQIQYELNGKWQDVEGLQINPDNPTIHVANVHTFDMVKTSSIRVLMRAQPNKALAITELRIFARWPKLN